MALRDNKIVLMGLGIALAWWILESAIHVVVFGDSTFIQQMFSPGTHELWMRTLTFAIIITFSISAQILFNGQKHAQEELIKYHDHLQELVAMRTAELTEINENLRQEIAKRKRVEEALLKKQQDLETAYEEITVTGEELHRNYDELSKKEQALRQSEEKFHAMADFTYDWEYWQGPDKSLIYISPSCECLTGYTQQEFLVDPQLLLEIIHPDDRTFVVEHNSYAWGHPQTPLSVDFRIIRRDGTVRWIAHTCQQITGPDGKHSGRRVSNRDITERKQAEEKLKRFNEELERRIKERTEQINASLEEKEVLLREIHHRVNNNLQILISLLTLQSRYITDEKTLTAIRESRNRIQAMALVHEKLYRSGNIAKIGLDEYVRFLGASLFQFYAIPKKEITFTTDIPDVFIDLNTAIPVGLILNELISNSLKHAFSNGRNGEISVAISRQDHSLTIIIKDTGMGIPQDFDWRNTGSLGLRLVISLVEQLDGSIELDRTAGTAFTIVVKEKE
ncbi:MAG: histidine kinase dimerization/phosphoacceptor domain -containing protein [Methanoregula sp.]|nr:histidine kinase dimerization/phosphoacceptor domain -containing protein [Methanoregula sp.]